MKDALLGGGGKFDGDYSYTLTQDAGGHSAKARLRQRTEKCRQCEYRPAGPGGGGSTEYRGSVVSTKYRRLSSEYQVLELADAKT